MIIYFLNEFDRASRGSISTTNITATSSRNILHQTLSWSSKRDNCSYLMEPLISNATPPSLVALSLRITLYELGNTSSFVMSSFNHVSVMAIKCGSCCNDTHSNSSSLFTTLRASMFSSLIPLLACCQSRSREANPLLLRILARAFDCLSHVYIVPLISSLS